MRARLRTRTVRAGIESDGQFGAVVPPVHLSSNFTFEALGRKRAHDYTRSGNPTRDLLAGALADLEGGAGAVVTSSGMAAIATVLQLLGPGDLLVAPHDGYGGTFRLLDALASRGRFEVAFVDLTDPVARAAAIAYRPRMVWIETPSNPLLRITDIRAVARDAREQGALVVVDNTFLSPVWQRPLELGADVVVHSTTKYLNGHSDVVGGAVVAGDATLADELAWWANCIGVTGAPFDAWLTLRGLRTLHARMRAHDENARELLDVLVDHPAIDRVFHPSLPGHPGHALAARQQDGFGAMLSFELSGGLPSVEALVGSARVFSLAESLGGVESLIAHPASMTHAAMSREARQTAGIGDGLVRISVGLEDPRDLVADLRSALTAASPPPSERFRAAVVPGTKSARNLHA